MRKIGQFYGNIPSHVLFCCLFGKTESESCHAEGNKHVHGLTSHCRSRIRTLFRHQDRNASVRHADLALQRINRDCRYRFGPQICTCCSSPSHTPRHSQSHTSPVPQCARGDNSRLRACDAACQEKKRGSDVGSGPSRSLDVDGHIENRSVHRGGPCSLEVRWQFRFDFSYQDWMLRKDFPPPPIHPNTSWGSPSLGYFGPARMPLFWGACVRCRPKWPNSRRS